MKAIPRFSVHQPVLVNLLMIGIFVGGLFSLFSMPQELEPNISFNWVFVSIPYPGASPSESEDLIVIPVEKELDKIENVTEIQSTAGEGYAFFLLKFDDMSSAEFTTRMQEVRIQIDAANIPDEIESDEIAIDDFGSDDFIPVLSIGITFDGDPEIAARVADDLSDEIERLNDVAKIQVSGLEDREIWIEVDPVKLNAHNLTLASVIHALAQRNVNFPGGNITIGRSEFQIRTLSRFESPDEINDVVLRTDTRGGVTHLSDIATVCETRAEKSIVSRLNGKPAITISVTKKAGGATFQLVDDIKEIIDRHRERAPKGIGFVITVDTTRYIGRILGVLRNNAIVGIIFIFGILFFFLGVANAGLASLGIPLSFMITFILMQFTGNTINGSTLFAMIVVLGIIVDDAIIVIENVHCHRQMGKPLRDAVVDGTAEVLGPVTTGILTTIAAFLPLMLLPGIMGKFMRVIPIVVSLALLASLFEAIIILPSHINDWTRSSKRHQKPEFGFYLWLKKHYGRLLRKFLRKRYLVIAGMIIILIGSVSLIPLVGVEMFGQENFDHFTILVKLPEGTALEETDRVISKIEAAALNLPKEEIEFVETGSGIYQANEEWLFRTNVGQVRISMVQEKDRRHSIQEMITIMRDSVATISGISSVEFQEPSSGPPSSKPVSIRLTGKYLDELGSAVNDIEAVLAGIEGVHDIQNDFPQGKQEIRVHIDEELAALHGLTAREIALELHAAVSGLKATTFRDGDEDVDIIVKLNEEKNNSFEEIQSLRITTVTGATIPLVDFAQILVRESTTEIKRRDLKRTVIVAADLDESVTSIDRAVREASSHFSEISRRYEEINIEIGGEFEEFEDAFNNIAQLFAIGVMLIYLILGTQFRSYIQPLVILCTVPFAFIGAMVGLLISGDKFGIVTLFGVVALAGIVVNDAIVMISFINNSRRAGRNRWESIIEGGRQRLRPIILTTVTTIGGLLPTVLGIGGASAVWRPLASTIAWGLLFSTVLTLLVIPCILAIVDDIKARMGVAMVKEE